MLGLEKGLALGSKTLGSHFSFKSVLLGLLASKQVGELVDPEGEEHLCTSSIVVSSASDLGRTLGHI